MHHADTSLYHCVHTTMPSVGQFAEVIQWLNNTTRLSVFRHSFKFCSLLA